ncbi:hypothetical protein GCM10022402_40550 [Salinactinospora qingdaonensis]|uniref:Uncharacterized protein n=1 Tax=Salinactinospora qingdaonensis TaxID=702744 RepID=A0ABP7G910_9ACTN
MRYVTPGGPRTEHGNHERDGAAGFGSSGADDTCHASVLTYSGPLVCSGGGRAWEPHGNVRETGPLPPQATSRRRVTWLLGWVK